MPSNNDLIKSISEVATEKGVEVPNTVGLNNNDLNETLKGLRALEAKPADSTDIKPEETPEEKAEAEAEAKAKAKAQKIKEQAAKDKRDKEKAEAKAKADAIPPYRVADGKSITCKKGVLSDGDEVKAEYLPGGKETLDSLVDRGFVIKK